MTLALSYAARMPPNQLGLLVNPLERINMPEYGGSLSFNRFAFGLTRRIKALFVWTEFSVTGQQLQAVESHAKSIITRIL